MADEQGDGGQTPDLPPAPAEPPPDPGWLEFEHVRGGRPRKEPAPLPRHGDSEDSRG